MWNLLNVGKLYLCIYSGAVAYSNAYFGRGSGPYYLDNVYCQGNEMSLFSCQRAHDNSEIGVHNCGPGKEAGVKCVIGVLLTSACVVGKYVFAVCYWCVVGKCVVGKCVVGKCVLDKRICCW